MSAGEDGTISRRERAAQQAAEKAEARRRKKAARRRRRLHERERRKQAAKSAATPTAAAEKQRSERRGRRKVREGVVTSARADKTIVVRVERQQPHPVYGKIVRTSKKFHAHDERNEAREGDVVRIVESRPLSRLKRWRLVEILERAR